MEEEKLAVPLAEVEPEKLQYSLHRIGHRHLWLSIAAALSKVADQALEKLTANNVQLGESCRACNERTPLYCRIVPDPVFPGSTNDPAPARLPLVPFLSSSVPLFRLHPPLCCCCGQEDPGTSRQRKMPPLSRAL